MRFPGLLRNSLTPQMLVFVPCQAPAGIEKSNFRLLPLPSFLGGTSKRARKREGGYLVTFRFLRIAAGDDKQEAMGPPLL